MATSKKDPEVTYGVLPGGDHAIGVTIDGVFVPFASLDPDYVQGRVESGKSPEAQGASDGENGGSE